MEDIDSDESEHSKPVQFKIDETKLITVFLGDENKPVNEAAINLFPWDDFVDYKLYQNACCKFYSRIVKSPTSLQDGLRVTLSKRIRNIQIYFTAKLRIVELELTLIRIETGVGEYCDLKQYLDSAAFALDNLKNICGEYPKYCEKFEALNKRLEVAKTQLSIALPARQVFSEAVLKYNAKKPKIISLDLVQSINNSISTANWLELVKKNEFHSFCDEINSEIKLLKSQGLIDENTANDLGAKLIFSSSRARIFINALKAVERYEHTKKDEIVDLEANKSIARNLIADAELSCGKEFQAEIAKLNSRFLEVKTS